MFPACLLSALMLTASAADQPEKEPPYQVPTPTGWAKESIALPPAFAPDMKWKGTEELRFAPGMFKADAPDFLSYALLFWLPDDTAIDAKAMERELLVYYRGLAAAVLGVLALVAIRRRVDRRRVRAGPPEAEAAGA